MISIHVQITHIRKKHGLFRMTIHSIRKIFRNGKSSLASYEVLCYTKSAEF